MSRRGSSTALTLAALAVLAWSPAAGAATHEVTYSPFAPGGALRTGLRATPAYGGSCTTGSFVVPGDAVFRCFAGNLISDPCYRDAAQSNAARAVVVCVGDPWTRKVVRLRVRGKLDSSYGARKGGPPWALRLASGARCVFLEGATNTVRGLRVNYGCSGGIELAGSPDTSRATWRIRKLTRHADPALRWVAVAAAWR